MASPIKKGRFGGNDLKEYKRLEERLGLQDTFGAESKTLKEAVRLANQMLDLKARVKSQFPEIF